VFALELALPVGTEFDLIGIPLVYHDGILYLSDGSCILAAIHLAGYSPRVGGIVIIENVKYQSMDNTPGVVHFAAFNSSVLAKGPNEHQRSPYSGMLKIREVLSLDSAMQRVSALTSGENSVPQFVPRERFLDNCDVRNGSITGSICDFETIDMFWNVNQMSVLVFGEIFVDMYWKRKFIESREEFDQGLNLILRLTDGIGTRIAIIPQYTINVFFQAIGSLMTSEGSQMVSDFFTRFFDGSCGGLKREREQMKNAFLLDVANPEMMLRSALFYCELVYDEQETIESMQERKADLVFPFTDVEWLEFTQLLRRVLCGIEMRFDLYDTENTEKEHVSIVSGLAPVDLRSEVSALMGLF
jgi:hypothetical protein